MKIWEKTIFIWGKFFDENEKNRKQRNISRDRKWETFKILVKKFSKRILVIITCKHNLETVERNENNFFEDKYFFKVVQTITNFFI